MVHLFWSFRPAQNKTDGKATAKRFTETSVGLQFRVIPFETDSVAKEKRLEAEEALDSIVMDAAQSGFKEARIETARSLRGLANEISNW